MEKAKEEEQYAILEQLCCREDEDENAVEEKMQAVFEQYRTLTLGLDKLQTACDEVLRRKRTSILTTLQKQSLTL